MSLNDGVSSKEYYEIKAELQSIAKDVKLSNMTLEKLERCIERLTEVSNRLTLLSTQHTDKIIFYDEYIKNTTQDTERRREIIDAKLLEASKSLMSLEKQILQEQTVKIEVVNQRINSISNRVAKLERMKYKILGAGVVIGALLTYLMPYIIKALT